MSYSLDGKVALVTGASSGIGLEVARKLVAAGGRVAMVARTRSTLEKEAASLGERAAIFPLDVMDLKAVTALPKKVVERFGRLDIVVNNAGLNHRGPVREHGPLLLTEVIAVNLSAPIALSRAALDHIAGDGAIVNVASIAGMVPVPDEATYCASKAGLRAFTRAFAAEHPSLRICAVSPGPVDTGFFGDLATVPDLVFSQPMSTADQVADAVIECIQEGTGEIAIPQVSGALATVGYLFPSLAVRLRPLLEKRGAANKKKFMERKARG